MTTDKTSTPSPICFFVGISAFYIRRLIFKVFHETGHAIHANSIGKGNEYWDKYRIPVGIEEIFPIFLEGTHPVIWTLIGQSAS